MQRDLPRQRGQPGTFTFENKLEKEEEILEQLLTALARNQLPPDTWTKLHLAAVRDDRLSELAFSYEGVSQGKRLKTQTPPVVAEFLYRASTFFSEAFGDELGAVSYLERALAAQPLHAAAFEKLDAILTKAKNDKALADLCVSISTHRPKAEQIELLKRAAELYTKDPATDEKATEIYQQLLRQDPHDEGTRDLLEARFRKANRHRDVARLAEQALTIDPPPSEAYALKVRGRLIELYATQLHEPERSMPHVEALLLADPSHDDARRVALKLLDVKGLAARAAAALASAYEQTGVPADVAKFLAIELEHTRGPKRRDVLRKIGVLRQDKLDDPQGAFEAFEQALALDPSDEELRRRFGALAGSLGKELDAARTLSRVGTAVKDPRLKARLTAELGKLYLAGGDGKRARATFVGVLATPDLEPEVSLMSARALCSIYAADRDYKALADALERVALLEPDDQSRQIANEELAELATSALHDPARAIGAWKRLIDTSARARALEALEPLYEAAGDAAELATVLEERSKDAKDPQEARALAFRAAEVLTTRTSDSTKASAAWRRLTDKFGAARDVHALWLPLLEERRQWPELAAALDAEATLAPEGERAALYAKLGVVRQQKTRDLPGAVEAFRRALAVEPAEKTSRSALEKLLASGDQRLAAAEVLEPLHRNERNVAGMLRVLDVKASLSDTADARLLALDEASTLIESSPQDQGKALEWVARGLTEAVAAHRPLGSWLERIDRLAPAASDPTKRASILSRGLGEAPIDSPEMLHLAKKTGEALALAGDVSSALGQYRRALAFEPSSTELLSRVDDLLREQGSPGERVQLYRAALERGPSPERRRELLHKIGAIQRSDVGDRAGAIETYKTALASDPDDGEARTALAGLYSETEAWDLLSELLEEQLARSTGEEAKRARARIAELAAVHGQPNRARTYARRLLEEALLSAEDLTSLEHVADALEDQALMREVLQRRAAASEDPRDQAQWLGKLGALELTRGATEDALATWKRAAQIAQKAGDDEAARRLYERVREVSPKDDEAALHLAELLERAEEWEKLPELYSILLDHTQLPSSRVSILMRHARVLADKMDDPASALVSAAQAFELASESSEYREVLSTFTALALQGKATHIFAQAMDDAIGRHAGDSAEKAAQRADLRMAKARVLSANRDGRDAAAAAYRGTLDDPGVDEGRLKAALLAFEMLLSREPPDAWIEDRRWLLSWKADHAAEGELGPALLSWASAEESTFGDMNRALELYRRVESLDPENADVLAAISRLALATGDTGGAITALAARRDRSEGSAKNALDLEIATILLYRTDRAEEALVSVDSVLKSAPQDEAALALAAQLLALPKAHEAAVTILERAEAAAEEPNQRAKILRHLLDSRADSRDPRGEPPRTPGPQDLRKRWYERLLDIYRSQGRLDLALATALSAVEELPVVDSLLDRAEELARELERPGEVAELYHRALAQPLPKESALTLGRRAVAFHEEWFEDSAGVVRILERVLEIDLGASWAFDRLKLLFDAAERWDDLFALFDRAAAAVTDDARRAELYEDAAQIAKDFANNSDRAIGYLEKLLPLKPNDARLVASLERLYERQGAHRELILLLSSQLASQAPDDAQATRARVARLWLDEIGDAASALVVIEEMIARGGDGRKKDDVSLFELLEKVLAIAPPHVESRESMPPAMEGERGRRDSVPFLKSGKRLPVRQRAAALLKGLYGTSKRDADLVRILEIELEAIKSAKELIKRHKRIAEMYLSLGKDAEATEHLASLVLLEPDVALHRSALAELAARIGRYDRLAEVLTHAADDSTDAALKVELMMQAGDVHMTHLADSARAIDLFLRVLALPNVAAEAALVAARRVEPLLEAAGRSWERLDVNEQIAGLQTDPGAKTVALAAAARLATELGENGRAIVSLEARLDIGEDADALDALIDLLEREKRWPRLIEALGRRARSDRNDAQKRMDLVRIARIEQDEQHDTEAAISAWSHVEGEFGQSDEGTDALVVLFAGAERWKELSKLLKRAAAGAELPGRRAEMLRRLGDVQRTHLGQLDRAVASYEGALGADPKNEAARAGVGALLNDPRHRAAAANVLMRAYAATDEWQLTLALTDHRLASASDGVEDGTTGAARARVKVLREAAQLAETRGLDPKTAFRFLARAFGETPEDPAVEAEVTRLAEATGEWGPLAEAYAGVLEAASSGKENDEETHKAWVARLRFRSGDVLETRLDDAERALAVYQRGQADAPGDLPIARAVIRVAAKAGRWEAAAASLVGTSRSLESVPGELPLAVEEHVHGPEAWEGITRALGAALEPKSDLLPKVDRDLEARLGIWHRDRRGDPDSAEAAFTRALARDPENAELLSSLAQIQRRTKGRPLIDSLLRLSRATGGDLDLLREAAEIATTTVMDRGLAKSILESLHGLAIERWVPQDDAASTRRPEALEATIVTIGAPVPCAPLVEWSMNKLLSVYEEEGSTSAMLEILVQTSKLPFDIDKSRAMTHQAAIIAEKKLDDTERAILLYRALFDQNPRDSVAIAALTALYERLGKGADLLDLERRRIEDADTPDRRIDLRLSAARIERSLGNVEGAVTTLRQNLEEAPRHKETFERLAELYGETSRFSDLAGLLASQAELALTAGEKKEAADAWERSARLAEVELAHPERAIQYHGRVIETEERPSSLDALARLLAARGDHARAAEILERLRIAAPDDRARLSLRLADALSASERADLARARLEEATLEFPNEEPIRARLSDMYEKMEAWEPLANLLAGGASHAPDKATRLARLLRAAKLFAGRCANPAAAVPLLEQASDLDPNDRTIKLLLADALGAASRFQEARTMLRAIIDGFGGRRPKERAPAHYHLARLEMKMGDRARALVELDAATRIDPSNPEILRALAELARDDGQLDRAERSFRALLVALPRGEDSVDDAPIVRSEVLLELSSVADRQGEQDRAREILESALEAGAKSEVEGKRLEQALRARGDHGTLVRALEARLSRAEGTPSAAGVLADLAEVLDVHLGHLARAFLTRMRAVTLTPDSVLAHEAALVLARRTDGVSRYVEEVERLAETAELAGDVSLASDLFVQLGRVAETDLKDDVRAARTYERAQSFHFEAEGSPSDGPTQPSFLPGPAPARKRELTVLRALDQVYERLGDRDAQGRILARRAQLESRTTDPEAAADALYRLAALRLVGQETVDEGARLLTHAFESAPDAGRAEAILEIAARAHPQHEGLIALYERVGRSPGRERALVEALALRSALEGGSADPIREAVGVSRQLGDPALAESLLRRFIELREAEGSLPQAVWALVELSALREGLGDVTESIALKQKAADVADPEDARRLRFEAARLAAVSLGDLELSAKLYESLLAQDPGDREAWEPLLEVYERLLQYDKLAELLGKVVDYVDDANQRSKLRLDRVRVMMKHLGLGDDAAPLLREIVDDDPSQVEAAILLAGILERRGASDELANLLAKQLEAAKDRQDSASVGSLSLRLGQLLEQKDPIEAKNVLYAGLDWVEGHEEILGLLARILEREGQNADRADLLERLLALTQGQEAEARAVLVYDLRMAEGDEKGAERALEVGFRAYPASRSLGERLERAYRERGEWEKTVELFVLDARARERPGERVAKLRAAAHLLSKELHQPAKAGLLLLEAQKDAPEDAELFEDLVETLSQAGQLREAIDEVTAALGRLVSDSPRRVPLLSKRASLRIELQDDAGALADLEEASSLSGDGLAAQMVTELEKLLARAAERKDDVTERALRLKLAGALSKAGDIEGSRGHLADLIRRDPKDREALRAVARIDELQERWDAVTATYRKLVALEEGDAVVEIALKLADACERAGRLSDARGALERARLAAPHDETLRDRLVFLYEHTGAYKELAEMSLVDAKQAKEVAGRFAHLVRAGSLLVAHSADPGVAISALEEAHALRPSDMECIVLLVDAYTVAGRTSDAVELVNVAIASQKGKRSREMAALYHRLARIAHVTEDRVNEIAWLSSALDMDAHNGFVAAELATVALEERQLEVATRALRAITLLKDASQLPISKAVAYEQLGQIAREQGDTKRAALLLKRAIDEDPSLASARALLAALQD
jgi:tetratricopeptide (TPR) repeat protein